MSRQIRAALLLCHNVAGHPPVWRWRRWHRLRIPARRRMEFYRPMYWPAGLDEPGSEAVWESVFRRLAACEHCEHCEHCGRRMIVGGVDTVTVPDAIP